MKISGFWYASERSTRIAAELEMKGSYYRLMAAQDVLREGDVHSLNFSGRLGSIARRLAWPDGAVFETLENDTLDQWLQQVGHQSASSYLHRFEKSWLWAAVSVMVIVFVVWAGFYWGLPVASKAIANNLPVAAHEIVSAGALKTLDTFVFEPSTLTESERDDWRAHFAGLQAALPEHELELKLHFRNMGGVPNAMALPSGDIIVTDDFVRLIKAPEEFEAVLLHEVAHVLEHHGMHHVVQASTVSLIVSLALGEVSGLSELAAGVPIFLLQSRYSRANEAEADEFAFAMMNQLGKDPAHFAAIIRRLQVAGGAEASADETEGNETDSATFSSYFSSHPETEERAQRALQLSHERGFSR